MNLPAEHRCHGGSDEQPVRGQLSTSVYYGSSPWGSDAIILEMISAAAEGLPQDVRVRGAGLSAEPSLPNALGRPRLGNVTTTRTDAAPRRSNSS